MKRTTLDIYITEVCNLNCEYCYVDIKKTDDKTIDVWEFTQRINLLEYEDIKFYWWEPLLKWKNIVEIVDSVHKKNNKIQFSIITNWLLLNQEKLEYCKIHNIRIAISVHISWMKRLLDIKNLKLFLWFRDQITFILLFRFRSEPITSKIFFFLAEAWFNNFSLSPVSNDPWNWITELDLELQKITAYIREHKNIDISESHWNELKNLKDEGFCKKEQVDNTGLKKACTRFDMLDFLDQEENVNHIDTVFNTINNCATCDVRWFCVCNKWWYLDNFWATKEFDAKKVKTFHHINILFISFYKTIVAMKDKWNYLSTDINEYRLNLTEQCNLRCEYCYLDFKNVRMSESIWKNIIDFLLEQEGTDKALSFLWWEPLIEFELLKTFVLYAKEKSLSLNKKIKFKIATNGLLFTEENVTFLKQYEFEIHLSLNGSQKIQDTSRDKSYQKVIQKLQLLKDLNFLKNDLVILMVIFPDSITSFKENVDHIFSLGLEQVYLEMYIWNKFKWEKSIYTKLYIDLTALYGRYGDRILNLKNKANWKSLDIGTNGKISENSLVFFQWEWIDYSPKKYLDLICKKILEAHGK